ncbi:Protein SODIUM POTASSIUM ROOT DEFECTIVE 3 [Linum perenne]
MKSIDIFCASQASTAICMTTMDQPSSSSSSAAGVELGGRAIDRHNPIIRDLRRSPRVLPNPPCSSQLPPITPVPYHLLDKSKTNTKKPKKSSKDIIPIIPKTKKKKSSNPDKKQSSDAADQSVQKGKKIFSSSSPSKSAYDYYSSSTVTTNVARDVATKSWTNGLNLVTPPGSSRYLLSDSILFDGFSDLDPVPQPEAAEPEKVAALDTVPANDENPVPISSPNPPPVEKPSNQIVELRVSLHCKGCEGKVRKHLSKMEGIRKHMSFFFCSYNSSSSLFPSWRLSFKRWVKSFSIDFAAKKVTIVGDLTPSEVLERLSKVKKNAQFWTSEAPNPAATPYNNLELKK